MIITQIYALRNALMGNCGILIVSESTPVIERQIILTKHEGGPVRTMKRTLRSKEKIGEVFPQTPPEQSTEKRHLPDSKSRCFRRCLFQQHKGGLPASTRSSPTATKTAGHSMKNSATFIANLHRIRFKSA